MKRNGEMSAWAAILGSAFLFWVVILIVIGLDGLAPWWASIWGGLAVPALLTLIVGAFLLYFFRGSAEDRRAADEERIRRIVREELAKAAERRLRAADEGWEPPSPGPKRES